MKNDRNCIARETKEENGNNFAISLVEKKTTVAETSGLREYALIISVLLSVSPIDYRLVC